MFYSRAVIITLDFRLPSVMRKGQLYFVGDSVDGCPGTACYQSNEVSGGKLVLQPSVVNVQLVF